MTTLTDKAQAVRNQAEAKYNESYGWQVFVECYSNKELEEFVADCEDVDQALVLAAEVAATLDSQESDVMAEVW